MKIQTQDQVISDPSKVAELPLVPAPGEASTELPKMSADVAEVGIPGVCESTLDGIGEPAQSGRPSLDVAIENLANLTKHVSPFCGRLRAWDTRDLPSDLSVRFQGSVEDLAAAFVRLGDQLTAMRAVPPSLVRNSAISVPKGFLYALFCGFRFSRILGIPIQETSVKLPPVTPT